jgi:hypothetical protein
VAPDVGSATAGDDGAAVAPWMEGGAKRHDTGCPKADIRWHGEEPDIRCHVHDGDRF